MQVAWKRATAVMSSSYSRGETDLFAVMPVFRSIGEGFFSADSNYTVSELYFRNIELKRLF